MIDKKNPKLMKPTNPIFRYTQTPSDSSENSDLDYNLYCYSQGYKHREKGYWRGVLRGKNVDYDLRFNKEWNRRIELEDDDFEMTHSSTFKSDLQIGGTGKYPKEYLTLINDSEIGWETERFKNFQKYQHQIGMKKANNKEWLLSNGIKRSTTGAEIRTQKFKQFEASEKLKEQKKPSYLDKSKGGVDIYQYEKEESSKYTSGYGYGIGSDKKYGLSEKKPGVQSYQNLQISDSKKTDTSYNISQKKGPQGRTDYYKKTETTVKGQKPGYESSRKNIENEYKYNQYTNVSEVGKYEKGGKEKGIDTSRVRQVQTDKGAKISIDQSYDLTKKKQPIGFGKPGGPGASTGINSYGSDTRYKTTERNEFKFGQKGQLTDQKSGKYPQKIPERAENVSIFDLSTDKKKSTITDKYQSNKTEGKPIGTEKTEKYVEEFNYEDSTYKNKYGTSQKPKSGLEALKEKSVSGKYLPKGEKPDKSKQYGTYQKSQQKTFLEQQKQKQGSDSLQKQLFIDSNRQISRNGDSKKQTPLTKSQTVNQFQQKYQFNKEYQQKSKTNIPESKEPKKYGPGISPDYQQYSLVSQTQQQKKYGTGSTYRVDNSLVNTAATNKTIKKDDKKSLSVPKQFTPSNKYFPQKSPQGMDALKSSIQDGYSKPGEPGYKGYTQTQTTIEQKKQIEQYKKGGKYQPSKPQVKGTGTGQTKPSKTYGTVNESDIYEYYPPGSQKNKFDKKVESYQQKTTQKDKYQPPKISEEDIYEYNPLPKDKFSKYKPASSTYNKNLKDDKKRYAQSTDSYKYPRGFEGQMGDDSQRNKNIQDTKSPSGIGLGGIGGYSMAYFRVKFLTTRQVNDKFWHSIDIGELPISMFNPNRFSGTAFSGTAKLSNVLSPDKNLKDGRFSKFSLSNGDTEYSMRPSNKNKYGDDRKKYSNSVRNMKNDFRTFKSEN